MTYAVYLERINCSAVPAGCSPRIRGPQHSEYKRSDPQGHLSMFNSFLYLYSGTKIIHQVKNLANKYNIGFHSELNCFSLLTYLLSSLFLRRCIAPTLMDNHPFAVLLFHLYRAILFLFLEHICYIKQTPVSVYIAFG